MVVDSGLVNNVEFCEWCGGRTNPPMRTMDTLQSEIRTWAASVFGPGDDSDSVRRVLKHMGDEVREAQAWAVPGMQNVGPEIAAEVADVAMLCFQVAGMLGFSLESLVRAKLEINRHRSWSDDPVAGYRRHVDSEGS